MESSPKVGFLFPCILYVDDIESLLELELIGIKASKCISKLILGPTPPKGTIIEYQKQLGLWATKLGSADSIVVRRMLAALTGNPHGLPGVNKSNLWSQLILALKKKCTRKMASLEIPSFFSVGWFRKKGPLRMKWWFIGQGIAGKQET
ncbi:hypothetical protein Sango_1786400 [Sesamum angolense]|uniref:Uncharacterized protein n=1 Tax=Sesamum angolense TaxID=2727404 RepID=A0AAE2BPM4_9LAMI|nr:hypothetical protein Sango_1786400 [Sesamum angolense]